MCEWLVAVIMLLGFGQRSIRAGVLLRVTVITTTSVSSVSGIVNTVQVLNPLINQPTSLNEFLIGRKIRGKC